jgi:threonine dehydrogenase-like Zn-dependent dehydrogenase
VVFDCVGSDQTLRDSLRWARAGGTVVMVGIGFRPRTIDLTPIWHQEVDLIGVRAHGAETWRGEQRRTYDIVVELMRAGQLNVEKLITHRFPLEQWRQAIETSIDKRSGSIKVVLENRPVG